MANSSPVIIEQDLYAEINENVQNEIKWGEDFKVDLQKSRNSSTKKCLFPRLSPKCAKCFNPQIVKRPQSLQNTKYEQPFQDKLLEGTQIVNRNALTQEEYLEFLSIPKKQIYNTHCMKLVKRSVLPCTPRIQTLSFPPKRRVYHNLNDLQNTLPIQKLDKLNEILQKDTKIFELGETQCTFTRRKHCHKIRRFGRRHKKVVKRPLKQVLIEENAILLSTEMSKHLCEERRIRCIGLREKRIANVIVTKLVEIGFLHHTPKPNDPNYKVIMNPVKRCALFLSVALTSVEECFSVYESAESTGSTAKTVVENNNIVDTEFEKESNDEGKYELEAEFSENEAESENEDALSENEDIDSLDSSLFRSTIQPLNEDAGSPEDPFYQFGEDQIPTDEQLNNLQSLKFQNLPINQNATKLRNILQKSIEVPDTEKVLSAEVIPKLTKNDLINNVTKILDSEIENSVLQRLQQKLYNKLYKYVSQVDPTALDYEMRQLLHTIATKLGTQALTERSKTSSANSSSGPKLEGSLAKFANHVLKNWQSFINESKNHKTIVLTSAGFDVTKQLQFNNTQASKDIHLQPQRSEPVYSIPRDDSDAFRILTQLPNSSSVGGVSTNQESVEVFPLGTTLGDFQVDQGNFIGPEWPVTELAASIIEEERPVQIVEGPRASRTTHRHRISILQTEATENSRQSHRPETLSPTGVLPQINDSIQQRIEVLKTPEPISKSSSTALKEDNSSSSENLDSEVEILGKKSEKELETVEYNTLELNKKYQFDLMPHDKDGICYGSVRAWAIFISQVAENSQKWCLWIMDTIHEMRRISTFLKGSKQNDTLQDPKGINLENFVSKINEQIANWQEYSSHVYEIENQIWQESTKDARESCSKCRVYNKSSLETIQTQVLEALSSTEYWRKWLNEMVCDCEATIEILTGKKQTLNRTCRKPSRVEENQSISIYSIKEITDPKKE